MQTIDKQAILDVLNSLEVIEQNGGESAYLLVENNVENHKKLNAVGVPSKTINNYGDDETFCILALALSEGYADHYNVFKGGLVLEPESHKETETRLENHFEEQWHSNRFQFLYMEASKGVNRDYKNLKALCDQLKEKQVGDFIHFKNSKTKNYEILIKNERFIIAASKSRNEYTIIDTEYGVCGPSNRTFGISVKSEESLKETLENLTNGEMYLSYRNSAPIDVVLA